MIALAIAVATDLRSQRIPNWLVFPFLGGGLAVSAVLHGLAGLGHSALGVLVAASVLGIFCWLGGMGMGDLKLCAAIGAWVGPAQIAVALVITGIVGGVMALCWAAAGGFLLDSLAGACHLLVGFARRGIRPHPEMALSNPLARRMPYAPAIALGTILSFFSSGV